jgi:hypothetical protein
MGIKKPGIPAVNTTDRTLNQSIAAIKECVEIITGARVGIPEINTLPASATNAQIISKINEIIQRLNASGN